MTTRGRIGVRQAILLVPVVLFVVSGGAAIARAVTFFRASGGGTVKFLPAVSQMARSMSIVAGILAVLFGAIELLVAYGLATHRRWARTTGIVVALIAAFFTLPVLGTGTGLLAFVVDLVIVATLVWDAMTDYPEEADSPTWTSFGERPTDPGEQ
jgi:hypothetical protein